MPDFLLLSRDGNVRVHLEKIELLAKGSRLTTWDSELICSLKEFQAALFARDPWLLNFRHLVLRECNNENYIIAPVLKQGECFCLYLMLSDSINM